MEVKVRLGYRGGQVVQLRGEEATVTSSRSPERPRSHSAVLETDVSVAFSFVL